jgi:cytochrome c oxidase assembly protein subunit 15
MFAVLVMGATVTNTGSEHGCGKSWPLCHGKLIPQFAVSTLIEWSHRAVVGVETVLILGLAAGALYLYRRRTEMRILVPLMVAFLFLQAALGAWAVMYPQVSAVLALHFGVSLVAFASVFLTCVLLFEFDGAARFDRLREIRVPRRFTRFVWTLTAFTYLVVYSGAYVRHTKADDACTGWPLCNGTLVPGLHDKVGSNFGHRLLALALTAGIVWLFLWARRLRHDRPDLYLASQFALGLVVLQAVVGALVVWTDMDIFTALAHAATVGLLFSALTYMCVHVLPLPASPETSPHSRRTPELVGASSSSG